MKTPIEFMDTYALIKEYEKSGGLPYKTPLKTIRTYCIHCVGGDLEEVRNCTANNPQWHVCPFHRYRMNKGRPSARIFRKFCLQCMNGSRDMVNNCNTSHCLIHPYRMGKHPSETYPN